MKTLIDKLVELTVNEATEEQLREVYAESMYSFYSKMSYEDLKRYEEDFEEN